MFPDITTHLQNIINSKAINTFNKERNKISTTNMQRSRWQNPHDYEPVYDILKAQWKAKFRTMGVKAEDEDIDAFVNESLDHVINVFIGAGKPFPTKKQLHLFFDIKK